MPTYQSQTLNFRNITGFKEKAYYINIWIFGIIDEKANGQREILYYV